MSNNNVFTKLNCFYIFYSNNRIHDQVFISKHLKTFQSIKYRFYNVAHGSKSMFFGISSVNFKQKKIS